MNCPQCHERVGNDQYTFGEPIVDRSPSGQPLSMHRILSLRCDCCGHFEIKQDAGGRILKIHGPFHGEKNIRRVERQIPDSKFHRALTGAA